VVPSIFRLVGCLLFSLGLYFWPLFASWMVFCRYVAFIPLKRVNALVLIAVFVSCLLSSCCYLPRGWMEHFVCGFCSRSRIERLYLRVTDRACNLMDGCCRCFAVIFF